MNLSSLGVEPRQERVYRYLLGKPDATSAMARQELGLEPEDFDAAIGRLTELGLITVDSDATVRPANPQAVVDRLVQQRIRQINTELGQVAAAREALPSLLNAYTAQQPMEMVERVDGSQATYDRLLDVSIGSREVMSTYRLPGRDTEKRRSTSLGLLREEKRYRTIIHRDLLANSDFMEHRRELHHAGDLHRITDAAIRTMLIYDRRTAFLAIEPDRPEEGALLIRQPGVVTSLVDLFEQIWDNSIDLDSYADLPNDIEKQVLRLMTSHSKDEVAARELGVSVRTFRRHVANLMARLGAANRFHAGQLAAKRGWI